VGDVSKDWVRTNASRFPTAPALQNIETGERYTWSELDVRVGALAGVFTHQFGIGRGDRVLLLAEGDTRTFELQFACMRIGAIMVPLNWRLSLPELVALARDAEPGLVVFDDVWEASARKIAETLGVTQTLSWRCEGTGPDGDYDAALANAEPVEPRDDLPIDLPTHILHTSGTTGSPKGSITTTKSMIWQTFNTAADALISGPGVKQLNPMPLFHAGGLTTIAAPVLLTGGCVATMRRFDAPLIAELLGDPANEITHFTAPPVMWMMLSDAPAYEHGDFSSLRFAQVAGGVPSLELLERWKAKGFVLRQAYGGTELGPAVTSMPVDQVDVRPTSCGRAVPFTHVRLVTTEGSDATGSEVGEVWIKGPSVSPGYWRIDPATDGSHVDGWFRTGDAAWRDEDGFYYLVDRYKDMYKSGGENVAPAEVERVLATHPGIADVAIIGVPDAKWGEVGRAFIVLRAGATLTLEDVHAHCGDFIARYKFPRSLVIVDSLPRNTTGKISKAELRKSAANLTVD
jgi:fatty-acyl-CoA synthase